MDKSTRQFVIEIDGRDISVDPGETILEVARRADIDIPTLCHHDALPPDGSCRLCAVEVVGEARSAAACVRPVCPGMQVRTESDALTTLRRELLRSLLAHYHDATPATGAEAPTEFLRLVERYGAGPRSGLAATPRCPMDSDPNPFIRVDLNKCILCTRCVRACADVQGRFVWGIAGRGSDSQLVAGLNGQMLDAACESCGACVAWCPTGALSDRSSSDGKSIAAVDRRVTTTCPYCGVGCNFDLCVADNKIVKVEANPTAPVNGMHLCVKGRYGYSFVHHDERLAGPRVRKYLLEGTSRPATGGRGPWVDVDWSTALDIIATRLQSVRHESGPDAIGLLSSAKCTNEENYLAQKFARQVIGTHNVDHCARLCHSSTVAGLAACFGSGAMSNTMADIAGKASALFVIGSNTTEQHPVFGAMLRQAVHVRGVPLVVADPRAVDIAEFATVHLQHRPGTDVALINGLMHIVLREGWHDTQFIEDRTENFEAVATLVKEYPPQRVAEITGIATQALEQAAAVLARNRPMAVIFAMGITQHTTGVSNVLSLGNLQMLLGNMGVAGGGVNPLRGQNNVQGACDMGALPNVLPGYQAVSEPAVQAKFARAWALRGGPSKLFSERAGLTVTEMVGAAGDGHLRALLIFGENPAATDPNLNHAHECLQHAEFTVLSEIFPSQTADFADVLLPAASWAEKSGTFTNTERRVQLIRKAVPSPGSARADWQILAEIARRVLRLSQRTPDGEYAGWDYPNAAEVLDEVAALTPSYAGVSHARLEGGESLHWPVADATHPGTPILHVGQFTRGRGRFFACEHLDARELPDSSYPMLLTTGRVLYHWHGGEMTRRVNSLEAVCPESLVEVNPDDADRLGLCDHSPIRLVSRRGEMRAHALVTDAVPAGIVFGNFHFPGVANVNNLTIDALDPVAKIPEYKVCAVRLETDD